MGTKGDARDQASAVDGGAGGPTDRAEGDATTSTKQRASEEEEERVTDQPADDDELSGDFSEGFSDEELRDFLAADFLEVQADPAYREGLRRKLCTMVSERYGRGPERKN